MKLFTLIASLCTSLIAVPASAMVAGVTAEPDSVYLFAYATASDEGRSGLRFAWSHDGNEWLSIGDGRSFLKCDYANWGGEKRMVKPVLCQAADGSWHCVWQLNAGGKEFGYSASNDLISWGRQTYFTHAERGEYPGSSLTANAEKTISMGDVVEKGCVNKVVWNVVEQLERYADRMAYRDCLYGENAGQDGVRFSGLKPVNVELTVRQDKAKAISDMLIGVFFEDINYGADGGLYAELVQNRDFEYTKGEGREAGWGPTYAWKVEGDGMSMDIETADPIHQNNRHYASLDVVKPGAALVNSGFDGIVLTKGEKYTVSFFARLSGGKQRHDGRSSAAIKLGLRDKNGRMLAEKKFKVSSGKWKQYSAVLRAGESADEAVLVVEPMTAGGYDVDMVSLFPERTFRGRKNGLRADLAQAIADIRPRFVRFPGGCVAHGQGLDNIYRWKNTIGPLYSRKPMNNLWGYHQTMGLGFFEYFQFCEDIGAEPLPVIAAGVPCQNTNAVQGELLGGGQQGGIPMDEMDEYIQDILDLVDYANADPRTNKWAKMRAESGHPAPFNLKYLGIGNEDQITDVFAERFKMIYEAVKKRHPEITVIGTVGPFYEGTDYEEGWRLADSLALPMVDEHYYNSPGWFIYNQDFYDRYDRNKSKVYLGEYAAHLPGRPNNVETALAEAVYLTSVERNGDVVSMASYAPLLAKKGHTQWNPDMIYFDNKEVTPTVGYYVQQLFASNSGDEYLPADVKTDNNRKDVRSRIASSVVRDGNTGDVIVKLVSMLPLEVNATINLPEGINDDSATLYVMSGNPSDKAVKPVESTISVSGKTIYKMPPYSLSVIRIKGGAK